MRPALTIPKTEVAALCSRYRVKRLSLFGSVLREDFNDQSDVDMLVEFEPDASIGVLALNRLRRELSALLGREVDLAPRSGLKPAVRDSVLRDELVIYAT